MTAENQFLCELIKEALFNIHNPSTEKINWEEVLIEADKHAIIGIIAKQIPEKTCHEWSIKTSKIMMQTVRKLQAQSQLVQIFEENNIPLAVLKGTAAAVYYPIPSYRTFGDIDFIVPQESFDKANDLMLENGYQRINDDQTENPRHYRYKKDDYIFEMHHHFSYPDLDIENFIIDGLKHVEYSSCDGVSFPMLPRLANGMVLLAHMRCHLLSGMGLRQVLDWMMFVNKELDDEFWQSEFKTAAESVHLDVLAKTVTRLCQNCFGLPESITWCKDVDEDLCDRLLDQLLMSGNFGVKLGKDKQFGTVMTAIQKNGIFKQLQISGEKNWKLYKKNKWLKPLCWLYQIFRYCRQGIGARKKSKISKDIQLSRKRYRLLKELKVI